MCSQPCTAYPRERRAAAFALAFLWMTGVACGGIYAHSPGVDLLPMMRRAVESPVSIVSFLCAFFLPFMMSAFSAFLYFPLGVYGICFLKAFLHSFVSVGLTACFPDCGWLLRWFLLFGDCTMPLMYWFWLRCVQFSERRQMLAAGVVVGSLQIAAAVLGYRCVFPFYWRLIESTKG